MSEVNRMVRMPEEDSKNPLTRLAEEIKKKTKKKIFLLIKMKI